MKIRESDRANLDFSENERLKSEILGQIVHESALLDLIYPIGSLCFLAENISPAGRLGGYWEPLTEDAYIKIVSENGGKYGGTSSDHKIPLKSIPPNQHSLSYTFEKNGGWYKIFSATGLQDSTIHTNAMTGSAGDGEPYYPYYFGAYVWQRIDPKEVNLEV